MTQSECPDCKLQLSIDLERCPHCGRPSRFPNVLRASTDEERAALEVRVTAARAGAENRGCSEALARFEQAVRSSHAVLSRSFEETQRLASSERELYATYYQLISAPLRIPAGDRWDRLRHAADVALFGTYKEQIRFAALSIDERALGHYGDVTWVPREDMIAHRSSVFHENSAVFITKHGINAVAEPPAGYRAPWSERERVAVAKHAEEIRADSTQADFATMVLREGKTPEEDVFLEVHVGGPITVRSLAEVTISSSARAQPPSLIAALREKLENVGVTLR